MLDWTISLGIAIIGMVALVMLIIWIAPYMQWRRRQPKVYLGVKIVNDILPELASYKDVVQLFKVMGRMHFTYVSGTFQTLHFFNYETEIWRVYERRESLANMEEQVWKLTKEETGNREHMPSIKGGGGEGLGDDD